jgi:adenine-specific DNA-methyltransferase
MNFKALESTTKLRGGYYTSRGLAGFLLRWVLQSNPRLVLEPSCGDGIFFRMLAELGGGGVETFTGFEVEPAEASKAAAAANGAPWAEVREGDFLGWALPHLGEPRFDGVVGNPPFIRYQYLDAGLQEVSGRIFNHFGLRFTKHTNAWVPFIIASMGLLRPGGRLAMVVPAELLHVLHAQSLRTFLTEQCSRLLVIDPEQLWFEDALQGAVLLLAEKKLNSTSHGYGVAIHQATTDAFLEDDPAEFFRLGDYANGETVTGKWMPALLSPRERQVLKATAALPSVARMEEVSDAEVGIVTGANKFFLVSDSVVEEHGLEAWAHPMFGRSDHVPGVVYDEHTHRANRAAGLPANFLWFRDAVRAEMSPAAELYLKGGEREGLHRRYKCRVREPWYVVPYVNATGVGMLKRSHSFPRLILNDLRAFTTDTAYRLRPCPGVDPVALVASFVNSLTALSAELEGRHYGGGVLELVPSEIKRLLTPTVPASRADLLRLDGLIRQGTDPTNILEAQDSHLLARAGLASDDCDELRHAWYRLKRRRHRDSSPTSDDLD